MIKLQHNSDTFTLTPNRRLAAILHKHYALEQNSECWQTPKILPINTWIEQLWLSRQLNPDAKTLRLLSPHQEQYLWEQCIAESAHGDELLRLSEAASKAKQAYMLATQWKIDINHSSFDQSIDCQYFKQWLNLFINKRKTQRVIDSSGLYPELIKLINSKQLAAPKKIYLVGFTDLSPIQQDLLASLNAQGCKIQRIDYLKQNSKNQASWIPIADNETEIYTMARWAKQIQSSNQDARIACVIPNLDKQRDRILQIFCEVFSQDKHDEINIKNLAFNISAGKRLTQYPAINAALNLLKLSNKQIFRESFSYLLCSPFIGDAESERSARCQLDLSLRKINLHQFDLLKSLNNNNALAQTLTLCPKFKERLTDFYQELNFTKKSFYQWSLHFNHLLQLLGWPGDRSLNSEEYQTVDAWMKLLQDFASIEIAEKELGLSEALHILSQLAGKAIYQPESPESNIQVLGVLEAASLPFDYAWVCGMDDYHWPGQAAPNPFLPKSLQVDIGVPHASAERELYYCQQLLKQFQTNVDHIIFSFAEKNDDIMQKISPLLKNLNAISIENLELAEFAKPQNEIFKSSIKQYFVDNTADNIQAESKHQGGSDILKLQALCPFRAFATYRLGARAMDKTQPGLLARDRGKIVHKILETIWNKVKNLDELKQLATEDLDSILEQAISQSLINIGRQYILSSKYIKLERQRLKTIINSWLNMEKGRDSFDVVACEKKSSLTLGKLTIDLIVDRIDQIEPDKYLIIDYKTGKNNRISSWFGDRPEEPQLPIYALLNETGTIAISFAQVTPQAMKFLGLSSISTNIKGIKPIQQTLKEDDINWSEQLEQWKSTFESLSHDFCQGVAIVDPKEATTCHYCHLSTLCRVSELEQENDNE